MKPFDLDTVLQAHGGKCITRSGHKAQIIKTDFKHPSATLLVILTNKEFGDEEPVPYYTDGRPFRKDPKFTLMVPETRILRDTWILVLRNGSIKLVEEKPDPMPVQVVASTYYQVDVREGEHR